MITSSETTIREIVAEDFRAAAVFQKYGIDFCCKGDRTVESACRAQGLDAAAVAEEIAAACAAADPGSPRFASWEPETLIKYIVDNHHAYVRGALPVLMAHTQKIASVHGERHPELAEVAALVGALNEEMTSHMFKEEHILFPYISELSEGGRTGRVPSAPFGTVARPVRMMEMEHESAGSAIARIRTLTGDFQPPEDACTTYRVALQELEAFERDLHAHVHLENNILFPKALALEAQLDA
jgi:regulator of cell morphogenesis and NO signaling